MSENKCAECKYLLTDERDGYKYKCDYYSSMYVYPTDSSCSHYWEDRYRTQGEIDYLCSGGCFFTTACMQTQKEEFKDDCYELETIRKVRDKFKNKYAKDIQFYYENAPVVVERIEKSPYKAAIYRCFYNELVLPTVKLIEENKYEEAYNHYKSTSIGIFSTFYPECLPE